MSDKTYDYVFKAVVFLGGLSMMMVGALVSGITPPHADALMTLGTALVSLTTGYHVASGAANGASK
jgi:hypothetical protein